MVSVLKRWLHSATFKLNSSIHGFSNKVRQSDHGKFNLSKYVITNQIAQTADVCKVMYVTLPTNSNWICDI